MENVCRLHGGTESTVRADVLGCQVDSYTGRGIVSVAVTKSFRQLSLRIRSCKKRRSAIQSPTKLNLQYYTGSDEG